MPVLDAFTPRRRRRLLAGATAVALIAVVSPVTRAAAATATTVTIGRDANSYSTCNIGADEGNSGFSAADLTDLGINAYRIYGGVTRYERTDDDGTYGTPTIAQIKANPDVIPWSKWDAAMSTPPGGSDYSWSTTATNVAKVSARQILQTLKDDGIRPVFTLRAADNYRAQAGQTDPFASSKWIANPPSTTADWNEWWEHVFATVYWMNVRNDYRVDDWEINNEPDNPPQGWAGTEAQYETFVQYTSDAIRYVYATYLPNRTPNIHAPATTGGSDWPKSLLTDQPTLFNTINVHNYDANIDTYDAQVHGWASAAGYGKYPLWLGEWGDYSGRYDSLPFSLSVLQNVQRGSMPGNKHVDGSLIFSMYDWLGDQPADATKGLVGADGHRTWSYYSLRMAIRALQGCQTMYKATSDDPNVFTTASTSGAGVHSVLISNSATTDRSVNVSSPFATPTATWSLRRQDTNHADAADGQVTSTNGTMVVTVPAGGAVLAQTTATVVVSDSFEDSSLSALSLTRGNWSVQQPAGNSHELLQSDPSSDAVAYIPAHINNAVAEGYVRITSQTGSAALLGRVQDDQHFYQLEIGRTSSGESRWGLWKNQGGVWTNLAGGPFTYAPNTYYKVQLKMQGTSIAASVSTDFGSTYTSLGTASDSTYSTGGVGFRTVASTAAFDDLTVKTN